VQDATGAIEVTLPSGTAAPQIGARLRISGSKGLAWGAPRIAAAEVQQLPAGASIDALVLRRAPAERDEWRLVRLSGTVDKVNRIGERWRAEVKLADGTAILVLGQAGSGIPSTAIVAGSRITVTGIVRRPYPTASDRRFGVLPRAVSDVTMTPGGGDQGSAGGSGGTGRGATNGGATGAGGDATGPGSAGAAATDVTPDTDLATIVDLVGTRVRVGGLVVRIGEDGFDLDDGTALAHVVLDGDVHALLVHMHEREAVAATGTVRMVDGSAAIVVDAAGSIVRVGTLGQALPIAEELPTAPPASAGGPVAAGNGDALAGALPPTSLIALLGLVAMSVVATMVRRRLLQHRLREALVERLAGLRATPTSAAAARTSRDSRTTAGRSEHESA
jgi:hypothetical protein